MQVNSNVSHHKRRAGCVFQRHRNTGLRKLHFSSENGIPEQPSLLAFAFVHEGFSSSEVSCWLALRACVLRRASSQSSTAQERRAEGRSSAVSPSNPGASLNGQTSLAGQVRLGKRCTLPEHCNPNPKTTTCVLPLLQIQWLTPAKPYFHRHQCWLTIRSTGPIAAGRHLG